MSSIDDLVGKLADIPTLQSKVGVFAGRDGAGARVTIGGNTETYPVVGLMLPPVGHPVQLEARDGVIKVTGAASQLPNLGVILSFSDTRATIQAWGKTYDLPYRKNAELIVGKEAEITWGLDGGIIQGALSITTPPPPPAPEPEPPTQAREYHPAPFMAVDSGTQNIGGPFWNSDVWASNTTRGAWFYGSGIADSIPDNAEIRLARIYLSPSKISGSAPRLQVHTNPGKGGQINFIGSYYELPARSGWVNIPLSFIDHLKANSGGLGMNRGGYSIFRGVHSDPLSGALDIAWYV